MAKSRIVKHGYSATVLTMSCDDYKRLLKILDEISYERGIFREELLAHQSKVRRALLDAGRDV